MILVTVNNIIYFVNPSDNGGTQSLKFQMRNRSITSVEVHMKVYFFPFHH